MAGPAGPILIPILLPVRGGAPPAAGTIRVGTGTVSAVYIGTTPATALYLGATKVWPP